MWIKNIEVTKVKSKGFDDKMRLGRWGVVKRVTVEFDVVMLTGHDEYNDPLEEVQKSLDGQLWYLRNPLIKAVYQKQLGRADKEAYIPDY